MRATLVGLFLLFVLGALWWRSSSLRGVEARPVEETRELEAVRRDTPDREPHLSDPDFVDARMDIAPSDIDAEPTPARVVEAPELLDENALWSREYEGATASKLRAASVQLRKEITAQESIEADAREEAGLFEVVPAMSKDDRPGETVVYSLSAAGEMRRIVLPPLEYPELYARKRKLAWLESEAEKRGD